MKMGLAFKTTDVPTLRCFAEQCLLPGTDPGFDCVEASYLSRHEAHAGRDDYLDAIREIVREADLRSVVHFPGYNLSEPHEEIRAVYRAEFRDTLDFADAIGARSIVTHPGYLGYYETPEIADDEFEAQRARDLAVAAERSAAFYRDACDAAAERGIDVLAENLPLPNVVARTAADLLHLKALVDRPNFHFVADTGHFHRAGVDLRTALLALGRDLHHLHIHDNDASYDQHLIPGRGTVDWGGFREALLELGYDGVYMLEIRPSSVEEIREAVRFVRGVMGGG